MRSTLHYIDKPNMAFLLGLPDQEKFEIAQQLLVSINISSFQHEEKKPKRKELVFPKVPKDLKPSQEVLDMVVGKLPADFDYDKTIDEMWEEFAR